MKLIKVSKKELIVRFTDDEMFNLLKETAEPDIIEAAEKIRELNNRINSNSKLSSAGFELFINIENNKEVSDEE